MDYPQRLVGGEQTRYLNFTIKGKCLYWFVFAKGVGGVYGKKWVYNNIQRYLIVYHTILCQQIQRVSDNLFVSKQYISMSPPTVTTYFNLP